MAYAVTSTPTYAMHSSKLCPRAFSAKDGQSTTIGSEAFLRYSNAHVNCALDKIPSPSQIPMLYPPEMVAHLPPPVHHYHDPRFIIHTQNDCHSRRPASAAVTLPKPHPRCLKADSRNLLSELRVKLLAATLRDLTRKRLMRSWSQLRSDTSMSLVKDSMKEIVATMSISDFAERVKVLFVPGVYEDSSIGSDTVSSVGSEFDKDALPCVFVENNSNKNMKNINIDKCDDNSIKQPHTRTGITKIPEIPKNTHIVSKEVQKKDIHIKKDAKIQQQQRLNVEMSNFMFDDIQETDSVLSAVTDTQSTYTPRYIVEQRRWEEAEAQRKQTQERISRAE